MALKLGWIGYFKMLLKGKKVVQEAIDAGGSAKEALEKSSWKSTEFWAAVLTGLGAVAAQAGGMIPEPIGPIVLTASAALYAISRGFVKHKDPLGGVKPGIASTETWGNIIASLGAVAGAAAGVCDPQVAAALVLASNLSQSVSRTLAKTGANPDDDEEDDLD